MMSSTPFAAQASTPAGRNPRDELAMSIAVSPTPSQTRSSPAEKPPDSSAGVGASVSSPNAPATIDA